MVGRVIGVLVALIVAGSVVAAVVIPGHPAAPAPRAHSETSTATRTAPVAAVPAWLPHSGCQGPSPHAPIVGVALGPPWAQSLQHFTAAVDPHPGAVVSYVRFGVAFDRAQACEVAQEGATLIIQMQPFHAPLKAIAAGRYDSYLKEYAHSLSTVGAPVAFSFGHEMNGRWYPWGYRHTRPSVFVAAWRHIHEVFARAGARNVIWLWTVDHNGLAGSKTVGPIRPWWPGAAYVNWVGADIYYNGSNETFHSGFAPTVTAIRKFTHDPILLAETAVFSGPSQRKQIANLFANVKSHHLLGLVWFDSNGRKKWYIDNRPPAVAAFRQGLATLGAG